jgi:predicted aspartyl protease
MSESFEPGQGLIKVRVRLWGPMGDMVLRLALDTGATDTLINVGPLVSLGYDPALSPERIQVTTGSSVEYVSRIALQRIQALEKVRTGFPVLCHTLPPTAEVDGLLGLDFFREHSLTVDFRSGQIELV